jgi:hypothetical protein
MAKTPSSSKSDATQALDTIARALDTIAQASESIARTDKPPSAPTNFPGFGVLTGFYELVGAAALQQAHVWNDLWQKALAPTGSLGLKDILGAVARTHEINSVALREVLKSDVRTAEWQHCTLQPGQKTTVRFVLPLRISQIEQVVLTTPIPLSANVSAGSTPTVKVARDQVDNGNLILNVEATPAAKSEEQWIAFAYEKTSGSGPPLGVVLVLIEDPPRLPSDRRARNTGRPDTRSAVVVAGATVDEKLQSALVESRARKPKRATRATRAKKK